MASGADQEREHDQIAARREIGDRVDRRFFVQEEGAHDEAGASRELGGRGFGRLTAAAMARRPVTDQRHRGRPDPVLGSQLAHAPLEHLAERGVDTHGARLAKA